MPIRFPAGLHEGFPRNLGARHECRGVLLSLPPLPPPMINWSIPSPSLAPSPPSPALPVTGRVFLFDALHSSLAHILCSWVLRIVFCQDAYGVGSSGLPAGIPEGTGRYVLVLHFPSLSIQLESLFLPPSFPPRACEHVRTGS